CLLTRRLEGSHERSSEHERESERTNAFRGLVDSTSQNHVCSHIAPSRHLKLEPAARDIDHVPILDIFWSYWLTVNGWSKIDGLSALHPVNYASETNIAGAPIITHPAGFHNHLVHSRGAVKGVCGWFIGKSGYGHSRRAVLQCDQHFAVVELALVAADQLMLKIDDSPASSCYFADEQEAHLPVPAHFLYLI